MARLLMGRRARSSSRGQILPLFVIFLTAMLLMMSLVLDASSALLMRRGYQSAADAAAMAAANVSGFGSKGCAASVGAATTAAGNSVAANLPGYAGPITVSCVTTGPYAGIAVQVSLSGASPGFFSRVVGINSFAVNTTATAINGQLTGGKYSVMLLDPTGCSSASFQGSFTANFEGSLYVDSSCPTTSSNAALLTGGNSGSVTFAPGTGAYVVGGYRDAHTPPMFAVPPVTGVQPISDQLAVGLGTPSVPADAPTPTSCGSSDKIFSPGNYPSGIQLKNSERGFLLPGLYYMQNTPANGGLSLQASAELYSVNSGFLPANCAAVITTTSSGVTTSTWSNYCTAASGCGVLIVNAAQNNKGAISVAGGAVTMLMPYQPGVKAYQNLLIWQLGGTYSQPTVALQGGGAANLTGGLYAPAATVNMGGGAGGSGGNLTIQFIAWDLVLQGTPTFDFVYNTDAFPRPMGYGLEQ
jgi:hypothetical protein